MIEAEAMEEEEEEALDDHFEMSEDSGDKEFDEAVKAAKVGCEFRNKKWISRSMNPLMKISSISSCEDLLYYIF